jgi:hypothetical protein
MTTSSARVEASLATAFGGPVVVELHDIPTVWEEADARP